MAYKKKLIEVALPLEDINREAAREKSIRHGHPSTLHLWWSRKPLAACRAVLFSSLVDDPSECVAELMADAVKRRAAEKAFAVQKKAWDSRKALFGKAAASGMPMTSNPPPGPEPKLEEILVETERERLFDIIRELVKWENSNDERVLNRARAEILRSTGGNPPPVYDPFCGGGSIPLEAQRLGLEAHASDLNPVPVLINKALIEFPPKFAGRTPVNPESRRKLVATGSWNGPTGLAEDIRYYGQWMRDEAEKRIGHLYPKVKLPREHGGGEATVIAWVWARTVTSPNPLAKGAHVPLVSKFQLSSKSGKLAWADPVLDLNTMTYQFVIRNDSGAPATGTVSRNGAICILTRSPITLDYIRSEGRAGRLGTRLMGVVAEGPSGRIYLSPDASQEIAAKRARPEGVPETDLPKEAVGFRVQNYGIAKHHQLFTQRQLALLTTFGDLVERAHVEVLKDSADDPEYATAIATYLGLCASKAAVFHSTLARWRAGEGKSAPAFGRQTISLVWEFAEVNPFAGAGGDLTGIVDGVKRTVEGLPAKPIGHATQGDASNLMSAFSQAVLSTDPPYYDSISYGDLSDYCYVWLRRCLLTLYPQLLSTLLVPKAEELVADPFRHGGKDGARDFFEQGMGAVFNSIRLASRPDFPTTIYYAFKQAEEEDDEQDDEGAESSSGRASTGWGTFLAGVVAAGWQVDGTWPMRTEGKTRMRSMSSNALASSIVLVCRPRPKDAGVASRRDFLAALKRELPEALRNLQKGNIAPVDLAQAAIGPGMAVFSRYARVLETHGEPMGVRTALSLINQSLDEVLAEQEGEFDADTRWALAWFDQYGFTEGAYGQAETLSTAKNTSVSGMVEAGILAAKGGKVRLLKKEELPADWDPANDGRLTVWEATHHLIRALDSGELAAAGLLKKLGAMAEVARDLSYRLYTVCERRKWAQDAIGYNALVLSWPDLKRLADEQKAAGASQGEMDL
jgi:putative DNA methylase